MKKLLLALTFAVSCGEKNGTGDITVRKHASMRCNLIEAAWVAIRQDPAMNLIYTENCKRMVASKAIVKVARKLVNRLFLVLKHKSGICQWCRVIGKLSFR